jgi:hypothetical protein
MYILIMLIALSGGTSLTSPEFADRPSCEAALTSFQYAAQQQHWDLNGRVLAVCVPKQAEKTS